MRQIVLITIILCIFTSVYAAEYYFCDKTKSYIHLGDNIAHVKQACGMPISSSTKKIQPTKTLQVTRWTYNRIPQESFEDYELHPEKDILIFDFDQQDNIVQIQIGGKQVKQISSRLLGKAIKIGDPRYMVAQAYLAPNNIQELTIKIPQKQIVIQTTLTYQQASYMPVTKLTFRNGKLISIGK
jgi:hypothetical protein